MQQNDLISRKALMEVIRLERNQAILGKTAAAKLIKYVNTAPAVEAAPVVHGRCEYCNDGHSFIGAKLLLGNDGAWHEINNCPNCGAKMDGERSEGE